MKNTRRIITFLTLLLIAGVTAQAQVRFGVKGGITLNELKFDKNIVKSDNRVGYAAGVMLEVGIPVTGLSIDGSVLYTHRENALSYQDVKLKRDYFDFPVNLKYKLQIPVLYKLIAPFVTTGPDFSLLIGDKDKGDFETRKWNTSWNVGFGAELFTRLQIHANYGIGLTKAFEYIDKKVESEPVKGKDRYWTVTAAFMF